MVCDIMYFCSLFVKSYMKYENGRLTGLVTSYAETAGGDGSDKKTRKKT
jgi:hypothetical protein